MVITVQQPTLYYTVITLHSCCDTFADADDPSCRVLSLKSTLLTVFRDCRVPRSTEDSGHIQPNRAVNLGAKTATLAKCFAELFALQE